MTTHLPVTVAGCVEIATITGFSAEVFGTSSLTECGKRYPQLLTVGIRIHGVDPLSILAWGPFVVARRDIVAGTYQTWRSVIPQMLKDPQVAQVAGLINTLFARIGLSCC